MSYDGARIRFYIKASGKSPVEEFLQECGASLRQDFLDALNLLAEGASLTMPVSRNLSSIHVGLHELRLKDRSGQVRVFYYIEKNTGIYVLHAFRKKTQALPRKEILVILNRIREVSHGV